MPSAKYSKAAATIRKTGFLICFLLAFQIISPGQKADQHFRFTLQSQFRNLGLRDGLTYRQINDILEDRYGFIWIAAGPMLFKYDAYQFLPYQHDPDSSETLSPGRVNTLLEDRRGRLWVGTTRGLNYYDRANDKFVRCSPTVFRGKETVLPNITALFEDSARRLWVGSTLKLYVSGNSGGVSFETIGCPPLLIPTKMTIGIFAFSEDIRGNIWISTSNGLWKVDHQTNKIQVFTPPLNESHQQNFYVYDQIKGGSDTLWLGSRDGLWIFETEAKRFTKIALPKYLKQQDVFSLSRDQKKQVWIGTHQGILQLKDKEFTYFPSNPNNDFSLIDPNVYVLRSDTRGNLWAGTFSGISLINLDAVKFPFFQNNPGPSKQDNFIHRIEQDSTGGFWFKLLRDGLIQTDYIGDVCRLILDSRTGKPLVEIKDFCVAPDGKIWVATLNNGVFLCNPSNPLAQHVPLGDSLMNARLADINTDLLEGQYIWISTIHGLCRIDRRTLSRSWYYPKKDISWLDIGIVNQFEQSGDGNIWCSLDDKGIIGYLDYVTKKFVVDKQNRNHPSSVETHGIRQFRRTSNTDMWVVAKGSLLHIDTKEKTFSRFTQKNGLPENDVMSVEMDHQGNLWVATEHYLCKFDGIKFTCFNMTNEIEGFGNSSSGKSRDNKLLFGGSNGFYVFDPDGITLDTIVPRVVLVGFEVMNRPRQLGSAYELIKNITLKPKENVFAFNFAALNYLDPQSCLYKYKLEGFNEDWLSTNANNRKATYTNLAPGEYTFRVLAINADGFESDEVTGLEIKLIILPPWYRTWQAYVLYLLAFGGILYTIRRYEIRRHRAKAETLRLQELDLVKTRLYTNISHEFRTPLTVIMGLAEQLKAQANEGMKTGLEMIRRNGRQVLHLVNQMLALAKVESGHLKMELIQGDVILYIKYLLESFQSFAGTRNIQLHFQANPPGLQMDYDPEWLQMIVSNLLSNALKFTPGGGDVWLTVEQIEWNQTPAMQLIVRDNGPGIPPKKLPFIFDRFYQADDSKTRRAEGTGIGLTLTRELVKLMKGQITVASEPGKGAAFTVTLPISRTAEKQNKIPKASDQEMPPNLPSALKPALKPEKSTILVASKEKPLVLLIEDNMDVVHYLQACLQGTYRIKVANDGEQGIAKALEQVPDLIVSDVMMPRKDGLEVCHTLKTDERTSHIPIILLTARADIESKLAGLRRGADAYLAKPFEREELLARIANLLEIRQKLYAHYLATAGLGIGGAPTKTPNLSDAPQEHEFVQKIKALIEEDLREQWQVDEIAQRLYLGTAQVHRKLKAITGMHTTEFVRSVRLKKASALLLEQPNEKIASIAYDVGFNTINDFNRRFKTLFGVTPSAWREHNT